MSRKGGTSLVLLEDVVNLWAPDIDLAPVVAAAQTARVDAGFLTDEELYLASPRFGTPPDPFPDAPRLTRDTPAERDAALAAVSRMMQAHGHLVFRPDLGDSWEVRGATAVLTDLRAECARVTVRVDDREQGIDIAVFYVIRPDLSLVETVNPDGGMHGFHFTDPSSAVRLLAGYLDRRGRARVTETAQVESRVTDLQPTPDDLLAGCETSARAVFAVADDRGDRHDQRSVTAYGAPTD